MLKDFLSIHDLSIYQFHDLLDLARQLKENPRQFQKKLHNKTLALAFGKPSFSTKTTFAVGMQQLGGRVVCLETEDIPHDHPFTPYELAKNLERWVDGIILESFSHEFLLKFTQVSSIPVINASSPYLSPCQALADFFTIKEYHKDPASIKLAYFGQGNSLCHSLLLAAAKAGTEIIIATPPEYEPGKEIIGLAESDGKETFFNVKVTSDPEKAAHNADIIYADYWTFRDHGRIINEQAKALTAFQVNKDIMARAKADALFMYGHPGLRANEVTDEIYNSNQSVVFDQAENRLHIQKAIMVLLMENKK